MEPRVSSSAAQGIGLILLVTIAILAVLVIGVFPLINVITVTTDLNIITQEDAKNYKVLHGDNVELQCEVESYFGIKSVKWFKMEQGELHDINVTNGENKYIVSGTKIRSLKINNFTSDDTGTYFCKVKNHIGLSNLSEIKRINPVTQLFKDLLGYAAEENGFTKIESLKYITKEMQVHKTDVKLTVLEDDISADIKKIFWLKRSKEKLSLIVPEQNPQSYCGGSCVDRSLLVKECNWSDNDDYICIMFDSENRVVNDSYLLYHLDLIEKPTWGFPEQLIVKGELDEVVMYVKHKMLVDVDNHMQRETRFRILFQRLANASIQNNKVAQSLFKDIYDFWLKELKASIKKKPGQPYFPAWTLILFLEQIEVNENRWIFNDEMSNFILLCGLILSAKKNFLAKQQTLFMLLLEQFRQKIKGKERNGFLKDMSTDLDPYGNTFFHYIVLFESYEATIILNTCEVLKNNKKLSFGRSNRQNITPLELSALLGKSHVFRSMIIHDEKVNKIKDSLQYFVKAGLNLVEEMTEQTVEPNFVFRLSNDFPKEVLKCVVSGTRTEYVNLLDLLSKSKLQSNIVKQELKSEFIKDNILRKYLIL